LLRSYGSAVSWVSEPDSGQTEAINKGLRMLDAEIVKWLNADDRLLPNSLALVSEYMASHPDCDFIYGDIEFIDESGRRMFQRKEPAFCAFVAVYGHNMFADPACFWRARLFDEFGGLDESVRFSMDYEFWVRLLDSKKHIGQVTAPLAQYRIAADNLSIKHKTRMRQEHFDILVSRRKWLQRLPLVARRPVLEGLRITARSWKRALQFATRRDLGAFGFSRAVERAQNTTRSGS